VLFSNKSTFIERNGEPASLILAQYKNMSLDSM